MYCPPEDAPFPAINPATKVPWPYVVLEGVALTREVDAVDQPPGEVRQCLNPRVEERDVDPAPVVALCPQRVGPRLVWEDGRRGPRGR